MKKRSLAFLLAVVMLLGMIAVPAYAAENVVYLNGSYAGTDSDGTAAKPYTTVDAAYAALPEEGGTVVVSGNTTLIYSTEQNKWPSKTGPVTITSVNGSEDYSDTATLTFQNTRSARVFVLFSSETTFENIHMDDYNADGGNYAVEFWSGPSLTFGEGVVTTIDGGKELTNDYSNGRWVVRMGSFEAKIDAAFTMHSGTLSYIQGGNNKMDVGTSTLYVGKDAVIVDKIQCGGTQKAVDTSVVTIEGANINELYLNGYGKSGKASTLGTITLTATNATIGKVGDQRSDGTVGTITGSATASFTGCTIGAMDFSTIVIPSLNITLDNTSVASLTKSDTLVTSASLTLKNGDYSALDTSGWNVVSDEAKAYVDQSYTGESDGSAEKPYKTLEDAIASIPDAERGTVILLSDYTIDGTYAFPVHTGTITITGNTAQTKIIVPGSAKTYWDILSPMEFNNLTITYGHAAASMEIFAGPSLTFGENMTFICCGGTITASANGHICVRMGYRETDKLCEESRFAIESGTISYIQGGSRYADVGDSYITVSGTAVITDHIQGSGTYNDVNNSYITIEGGSVAELSVGGYGSGSNQSHITGSSTITITGGEIIRISGYRKSVSANDSLNNVTMSIGGDAVVGSIDMSGITINGTNSLTISNNQTLSAGFGDFWDSITVGENAYVKLSGDLVMTETAEGVNVLTVKNGAVVELKEGATIPSYTAEGTGKVITSTGDDGEDEPIKHTLFHVNAKAPSGILSGYEAYYLCLDCDKYFEDAAGTIETTLDDLIIPASESVTYHDYVEGSNFALTHLFKAAGGQGNAIYGNTIITANNQGNASMYDMRTGLALAVFPLASYTATNSGAYANHANQIMFGATKFDESDPFPLLYVTTGNSGIHDATGAYVAKCSVERILYSEKTGWYAECVQIIEFNDMANIPEQEGNPNKNMNSSTSEDLTNMYIDGKFTYISGNGYDASKGYQKVGWGWPASFVDSDPTADTAGKFYLYSARFRTTQTYENHNRGVYGNNDANWDYFDVIGENGETVNAYIVTEFDMPALPASTSAEDGYGATVTLYPRDITDQFVTEYEIGVTQGGTMYRGKIYYSYGWNGTPDNLYKRNGIQVFDIAQKKITAKLPLYNSEVQSMEPECCSIWNGELVLGLNGGGYQIYVFDYVALDPETTNPTCTENSYTHINCSLCGYELSGKVNEGTMTTHDLTKTEANAPGCTVDGNIEYYTCADCGKIFGDAEGKSEITAVVDPAHGHDLVKTEAAAPSCTVDGNVEYYTCSHCGKIYNDAEGKSELESVVDPAHGHNLVKTEAKAPTAEAEGNIEYYTCTVCGKLYTDATAAKEITLEDTVIPKVDVPTDGSPETGELVPMGLVMSVMLLSCLAFVVTYKKRII